LKNPKVWRNKKGRFHRIGGPAIIWKDGHKQWRRNGVLHRLDGPADVWEDGITELWYINGKEVKPIPKHILLWRKKLNA